MANVQDFRTFFRIVLLWCSAVAWCVRAVESKVCIKPKSFCAFFFDRVLPKQSMGLLFGVIFRAFFPFISFCTLLSVMCLLVYVSRAFCLAPLYVYVSYQIVYVFVHISRAFMSTRCPVLIHSYTCKAVHLLTHHISTLPRAL